MIKLGKLTDYAIVVMGQLSKEGAGSTCSAHYLANATGVPEPTVAKMLKALAKKDLVISVRGVAGGYKLARAAGQISVAEIITAMDGPILIAACVKGHADNCQLSDTCPVNGRWNPVNDTIRRALEAIKLPEMVV